jgi:hypothetical protein
MAAGGWHIAVIAPKHTELFQLPSREMVMSFFNTSAPADQRRPKAPGMRTNTEGHARFDRAAANPPRGFRAMPRWLRATGVAMVAVLAFGATSAQAQGGFAPAAGDVTGAPGGDPCPYGFVPINNVCVANLLTDVVRPANGRPCPPNFVSVGRICVAKVFTDIVRPANGGSCPRGFERFGRFCVASDFTAVPPRDPDPGR